jgi:hypothetical protein
VDFMHGGRRDRRSSSSSSSARRRTTSSVQRPVARVQKNNNKTSVDNGTSKNNGNSEQTETIADFPEGWQEERLPRTCEWMQRLLLPEPPCVMYRNDDDGQGGNNELERAFLHEWTNHSHEETGNLITTSEELFEDDRRRWVAYNTFVTNNLLPGLTHVLPPPEPSITHLLVSCHRLRKKIWGRFQLRRLLIPLVERRVDEFWRWADSGGKVMDGKEDADDETDAKGDADITSKSEGQQRGENQLKPMVTIPTDDLQKPPES